METKVQNEGEVTKLENGDLIVHCPLCDMIFYVEKKQTNCRIFRCGFHKKNLKQLHPHLPEQQCLALLASNSIFGCATPFELLKDDSCTRICCYKK